MKTICIILSLCWVASAVLHGVMSVIRDEQHQLDLMVKWRRGFKWHIAGFAVLIVAFGVLGYLGII